MMITILLEYSNRKELGAWIRVVNRVSWDRMSCISILFVLYCSLPRVLDLFLDFLAFNCISSFVSLTLAYTPRLFVDPQINSWEY